MLNLPIITTHWPIGEMHIIPLQNKVIKPHIEKQSEISHLGERHKTGSYKDLAFDLARIACRVSCALANRDAKGITQIKWRQHQRQLKKALKEQHEITEAIMNNESR